MGESRIVKAFSQSMATIVRFVTLTGGIMFSSCLLFKGTEKLCGFVGIPIDDMITFIGKLAAPVLVGMMDSHRN